MKNKQKKYIFVQDWGTFGEESLVVCGYSMSEVIKWCKKNKIHKDFTKWVEKEKDDFDESLDTNEALYCWNSKHRSSMFLFKKYEDTWHFWETLMHELHHAVEEFSTRKCPYKREMELLAYQQEYLFRSIRRKLQGIDKIT